MAYAIIGTGIIDRHTLRDMSHTYFVFGDNVKHTGMGGQASEARGEPNAIGLPTKWSPGWGERDYFGDQDYTVIIPHIQQAFVHIERVLSEGHDVVFFPSIGMGYAKLPQRAPQVYGYIGARITDLLKRYPRR